MWRCYLMIADERAKYQRRRLAGRLAGQISGAKRRHPDLHEDLPRRDPRKAVLGPVPTLAELSESSPWMWVRCRQTNCTHQAPIAFVPPFIR
jgi:hypothetical protein